MTHRLAVLFPVYGLVLAACYAAAFQLRFDFAVPSRFHTVFWLTLPFVLLLKSAGCLISGEWRRTFRYASVSDMAALGLMTLGTTSFFWLFNLMPLGTQAVPRGIILIDAIMSLLTLAFLRVAARTHTEILRPRFKRKDQVPTLIYGVRKDSIGILRMLHATADSGDGEYRVVGFVDGDSRKHNSLIAGLPVYAEQEGWESLVQRTGAQRLLIPAEIPGRAARALLRECAKFGLKVHVIPGVDGIVNGRFKLAIRDLTVSDLLRREPNQLDRKAIRGYVQGRRVLVTGGAGSIGSELCRQIQALKPATLVILDQSEFGIFTIEQEFRATAAKRDVELHFVIADVADEASMARVMEMHQPEIVFHAAAYKHVPLMEDNPQAAVLNNILGTKTVCDLAEKHNVQRFVMISTDKAVRPTSVMGATKLIAEKYLQSIATGSRTRFVAVRFGNVLNSAGSVVPTFRKQIERGGPITVTHPEMERFFMTIPEAVQLVMQAGAIGNSGEVLILDMGEPVKIVDLAKDLILLSGLRYPADIDIKFTGMRPGEKLYEELFYASESGAKKVHDKIYSGTAEVVPPLPAILFDIRRLEEAALSSNIETLQTLQEIVARFSDSHWVPSRLRDAA
ncbi:MAG: polysaccharide biosynthesis protein [Planctomycetaceae bacterium]|nr:polysaccharide biosynthesis protein [Planctomycetaceae bacterium]